MAERESLFADAAIAAALVKNLGMTAEKAVGETVDSTRDENGYPKRWSDPTYLGDGPWGA